MFLIPLVGGFVAMLEAAVATAIQWAATSAIIGGLIGGGVGAGSEIVSSVSAGEEIQVAQVAESALHGAATGAIGGAASGAIVGGAVGGAGAAIHLARHAHLAANAANVRHAASVCSAGCVYGIRHASNANLVKIGFTTNPAQRLPHLINKYKTSSQYSFIKPVNNGMRAETALHHTHRASQVTHGVVGKEFFALDDFAVARSFSY